MTDNFDTIDIFREKTLSAAEGLLLKLKGTMSLEPTPAPIFEQCEVNALETLIEFHCQ